MCDIFISYHHEGGSLTAILLECKLKHDGYSVFLDKSSEKGIEWDKKIKEEINNCTDFIVILEKGALRPTSHEETRGQDWLEFELSHAIKNNKVHPKKIFRIELPGFEMPKENELPQDIVEILKYDRIQYNEKDDFNNFDIVYEKLTRNLKTRTPKKKLLKPFWPLLFWIVVVIIGGGSWYLWKTNNEFADTKRVLESTKNELLDAKLKAEEPILLLVGGGSVKGYLEIEKKIPITKSREWVYIPTSTGAALPIISKEIDVQQNNGNDKLRQYNLVVFSAIRADNTDLIPDSTTREKFINNIGHVIGTKIGSNDLKVVLRDDDYFKKYLGDDTLLTPKVLAKIVKDKNVTVFTTSNNNGNRGISGTFKRYTEILKGYVDLEKIQCEEFNSNQRFTSFNKDKKPFIILENTTFAVDSTNNDAGWFSVPIYYDKAKQKKLQNDLYVYFVAHKKPDGDDESYYVPEQVRQFLKSIGDTLPDDKDLLFNPKSLIQEYNIDGTRCKE